MKTPKITVYIASHNYGKFLTEAIESVLRQSTDSWELLVIDDNSTDDTSAVMQRYSGDERVRLFHVNGIGLHGVCNLALREARGQYIIRLDGDDRFDENILLILSHHLDANPNVALVFPDYYLMDEFGEVFSHERRQKLYTENHSLDAPPNGACFLARCDVLKEVGGYSNELPAQDGYYIWTRIIGAHKCANINLPLYFYRRHGQNLTNRQRHILETRRQIKRQTSVVNLESLRPFVAVIPCRKNYDYCPDLWRRSMHDRMLVEKAIEACLGSKLFDHVVVACDNPEVERVMNKYDDSRLKFFLRQQKETIRSESIAPTLERVLHNLNALETGVTVVSYVQAPFVTTDTLEEALFTLIMNNADCSVGVEELDRRVYQRSSFGLRPLTHTNDISSDFNTIFVEAKTVFATRNANLKTGSLTGPRVVNFVVSKDENFLIDSERAHQIAAIMSAQKRVLGI